MWSTVKEWIHVFRWCRNTHPTCGYACCVSTIALRLRGLSRITCLQVRRAAAEFLYVCASGGFAPRLPPGALFLDLLGDFCPPDPLIGPPKVGNRSTPLHKIATQGHSRSFTLQSFTGRQGVAYRHTLLLAISVKFSKTNSHLNRQK